MTDYDDGGARDLAAQRKVREAARAMLPALRELLDAYGKSFPRIIGYDYASGGPIIADDGAHRIMGNAENAIAQAEAAGITP